MSKIKAGIYVNVHELNTTKGMIVSDELLNNRRLGIGKVLCWVPGHGGDVWCVLHSDETQAVYSTEEMIPIYAVFCRECGGQMNISEIQTVADKSIVGFILEETDSGIGIYRCECGGRVYILAKKEDDE